jgi:hypothetical protein
MMFRVLSQRLVYIMASFSSACTYCSGEKQRSLAIDVFADQHLNIDESGRGDLGTFLVNINRWASADGLVIHQGDSTALDSTAVQELVGSSMRLFSVDGGHTEQMFLPT